MSLHFPFGNLNFRDMPPRKYKKHLNAVLGKDVFRSAPNAQKWHDYILNQVPLPTKVSGIEEFSWEEPYVIGGWDQEEYKKLKKTNPSYSDIYDLVEVSLPEGWDEIMARIVRVSDQSAFYMRLWFFEGCSGNKVADSIIDTYAYWHYNY